MNKPNHDEDMGFLKCFPFLLKPGSLLCILCCFVVLQSMLISGLTPAVISSLEQRFDLPSVQSGFIISIYDIGVVVLVIPISFIGSQKNKIRILGLGFFILSIGSLVISLAHFAGGKYAPSTNSGMVCVPGATAAPCTNGGSPLYALLLIGMLLVGVGATPLYTLGPSVLDDAVDKQTLNVFLGIFYAVGAVGPAFGFIGGGSTLNDWVDIGDPPSGLTPEDPQWVGRWWLCYVIIFILGVVLSFPFFLYPKYLPGTAHIREAKQNDKEVEGDADFGCDVGGSLDFKACGKQLLTNKPFMFNIIAQAFETLIVASAAAFIGKAVQAQYGISAADASMITGAVVIPGAAGGTFLGGLFMQKTSPPARSIGKICVTLAITALCMSPIFFIGCDAATIAGINTYFPGSSSMSHLQSCNNPCSCSDIYSPVCGNEVTYYNPCYAGCLTKLSVDSFSQCQCPFGQISNSTFTKGICASSVNCKSGVLGGFMFCLFVIMFTTFLNNTPSNVAILRVVPLSLRATALAMSGVTYRIIGGIPGPILFGWMLDTTCAYKSSQCHSSSCDIYSTTNMRLMFFILCAICKTISSLFFFLSWRSFKAVLPESATEMVEVPMQPM